MDFPLTHIAPAVTRTGKEIIQLLSDLERVQQIVFGSIPALYKAVSRAEIRLRRSMLL